MPQDSAIVDGMQGVRDLVGLLGVVEFELLRHPLGHEGKQVVLCACPPHFDPGDPVFGNGDEDDKKRRGKRYENEKEFEAASRKDEQKGERQSQDGDLAYVVLEDGDGDDRYEEDDEIGDNELDFVNEPIWSILFELSRKTPSKKKDESHFEKFHWSDGEEGKFYPSLRPTHGGDQR